MQNPTNVQAIEKSDTFMTIDYEGPYIVGHCDVCGQEIWSYDDRYEMDNNVYYCSDLCLLYAMTEYKVRGDG